MAISKSNLATAKAILSAVGSIAATVVVVRGVTRDLLPPEFHDFIFSGIRRFFSSFSNQLTLVINEYNGLIHNGIYDAAETYLATKISPSNRRLRISKPEKEKHFSLTMEREEEIVDIFNGEKFKWLWMCDTTEAKCFFNPREMNSPAKTEVRSFELTFHKKNRDMVLNSYLPYVANEAKTLKQEKKTIKIHTVDHDTMYNLMDMWKSITLDHPATFDTLAMDTDQKEMILKDLERFVNRREYYKEVGKAWKRGYLLYGPPGTGKSSLIAAMANYLNFDVYDLELTDLKRNSELRRLLVATANRSILVVEDIDCSIDLQDRLANRGSSKFRNRWEDSQVTLSGLLNFVDGLWSSCGDERIIIFTTNHIEKLDPALLRPGRMDMHIHMSYCTPSGFRLLASNYLGIKDDHVLFEEIEDLITNAKVTPAEVAEQLLKDDDPKVSLQGLIIFCHRKIKENEEAEAKRATAEAESAVEEETDELED
ncbi:hypothetical protein ACS0TY_030629 [Phlomoides rotata]